MKAPEPARYAIANHQNLPLELHLASGVIVLQAYGVAEVSESDLVAPQLLALQRRRLLSTRRLEPTPPAAAETAAVGATHVKPQSPKAAPKGRRGKRKAEA